MNSTKYEGGTQLCSVSLLQREIKYNYFKYVFFLFDKGKQECRYFEIIIHYFKVLQDYKKLHSKAKGHFDLLQDENKHFVCRIKANTTRTILKENVIDPDTYIFYV